MLIRRFLCNNSIDDIESSDEPSICRYYQLAKNTNLFLEVIDSNEFNIIRSKEFNSMKIGPADYAGLLSNIKKFNGSKLDILKFRINQNNSHSGNYCKFITKELSNLIILEFLFKNDIDFENFIIPDFAAEEITNDPRYELNNLIKLIPGGLSIHEIL